MEMVMIRNNDIFTNSLIISEGVGLEHRAVISLLKKHSKTQTLMTFEMSKVPTSGRPVDVAFLSEMQATFLITLMKNSEKVVAFKERLTIAFFNQRRIIEQRYNVQWLEKRKETKVVRKECTDIIKSFIEYAEGQGSQSASMYYVNISKMELKGLFLMEQKYPNARDIMNIKQLNLIEMADEAVAIALKEGMDQQMHYKECYKHAKERIEMIAKIFPPSPLPQLLENKIVEPALLATDQQQPQKDI